MTGTGEWRQPMTRFQHLAAFIEPGEGLDGSEKVAVTLWKLASEEQSAWDNDVVKALHFVENSVLQVPFFLMSLMRLYSPTLDNMFEFHPMLSLVAKFFTGSWSPSIGLTELTSSSTSLMTQPRYEQCTIQTFLSTRKVVRLPQTRCC